MNLIPRAIKLNDLVQKGKVVVIYGPRQVGKTTLIKQFLNTTKLNHLYVTGDDLDVVDTLSHHSLKNIKSFIKDYQLIVIDEAHRIPNIGLTLKLMVDNFPNRYFIATGSSSFSLADKTAEPLTGRKKVVKMYPIWLGELAAIKSLRQIKEELSDYLVYGMYPAVLTAKTPEEKQEIITEIANSYLLKDVLSIFGVRRTSLIWRLLKLIAYQLGSEVSLNELANSLKISVQTVQKYLDILEEAFVLFHLEGFSRNLRSEVVKSYKYYFYDVGIRNAVISNFKPFHLREDEKGGLWENFMIMERIKKQSYSNIKTNYYFWRTYEKDEIDLIEERDGTLFAYEFKYSPKSVSVPSAWKKAYPNSVFNVVTSTNFEEFAM